MDSQCCHSKCFGHNFAALVGRIFIGILFFLAGISKLSSWQDTVVSVSNLGIQFPSFFVGVAFILEVLGGLSLILGYKTRLGAFLLILFIIPATLLFHSFWTVTGQEAMEQARTFINNLGLLGGLLLLSAFGGGKYSFDACCQGHHVCATSEHLCEREDKICK